MGLNFVHLSHLQRLRGTAKVAAICHRIHHGQVEFLLVETGGSRWTFPKGNMEAGLTGAQSAALEAFEEAGVHGRMEEESFAKYVQRKRSNGKATGIVEIAIAAYLCEVLWMDDPQEEDRNPTWFRSEKAKRRLRVHRSPEDGAEHCRIVDLAVPRILRLRRDFAEPSSERLATGKKK